MADFQHIRVSQFIFSFGPGAIIESKEGSRLIPALNSGLGENFQYLPFCELTDARMTNYISTLLTQDKKVRVFSLPTNAKLNVSERTEIYSTIIFPEWKICYHSPEWRGNQKSDGSKSSLLPVLHNRKKCPTCGEEDYSSQVRFIRACPQGHMDDIDWVHAVHKGKTECKSIWYLWEAKGSSAGDIEIICPICHASVTMGDLYSTSFPCNSRLPEKETKKFKEQGSPWIPDIKRDYTGKCPQKMRVVQRRSTSLRVPENITLLKIPEFSNRIARILQKENVIAALNSIIGLIAHHQDSNQIIEIILTSSLNQHKDKDDLSVLLSTIHEKGVEYLINLFKDIHNPGEEFIDLMYKELDSLLSAGGMIDPDSVLIMKSATMISPSQFFPELSIFPIEKITSITVQTGYHRMVGKEEIKPGFQDIGASKNFGDERWYPGFEGIGEGLFITPKDGILPDFSHYTASSEWANSLDDELIDNNQWGEMIKKPGFIWLHTLSHALIHSLSLFCGYSAASMRERIYVNRNGEKGGVLIYNTSPGDDSGMGGLCGAADEKILRKVMEKVVERLLICSNDPLCHMMRKVSGSKNGAACYSCLLLSETSCEHRNFWLDRHLVIGD